VDNVAEMIEVAAILESREPSESLLTSRATKLQGNLLEENIFDKFNDYEGKFAEFVADRLLNVLDYLDIAKS